MTSFPERMVWRFDLEGDDYGERESCFACRLDTFGVLIWRFTFGFRFEFFIWDLVFI